MSQRIGIDSVKCDFNSYPYEVVTYARLSIIREKSVTERSLVTRGRLLNSTRSDNESARLHPRSLPCGGKQGHKSI